MEAESIIKNDEIQAKERRIKDVLVTSGLGVILFGVWSVVKTILQIILSQQSLAEFSNAAEGVSEEVASLGNAYIVISVIIAFAMLGIDLGLRLFAGLSARAEGKGKKKGIAYIIVTFILIVLGSISVVSTIISVSYVEGFIFDTIITLIVDITALLALVELAVSGIRLKRLKKKMVKCDR